jgi:hypothetical protein
MSPGVPSYDAKRSGSTDFIARASLALTDPGGSEPQAAAVFGSSPTIDGVLAAHEVVPLGETSTRVRRLIVGKPAITHKCRAGRMSVWSAHRPDALAVKLGGVRSYRDHRTDVAGKSAGVACGRSSRVGSMVSGPMIVNIAMSQVGRRRDVVTRPVHGGTSASANPMF